MIPLLIKKKKKERKQNGWKWRSSFTLYTLSFPLFIHQSSEASILSLPLSSSLSHPCSEREKKESKKKEKKKESGTRTESELKEA